MEMIIINTIYAILICLTFVGALGSLYYYSYKFGLEGINLLSYNKVQKGIFASFVILSFIFCYFIIN